MFRTISVILGAALLVCTYFTDRICSDEIYLNRINERERYTRLNADPHQHYDGYTVEDLGQGYSSPEVFFSKKLIKDFPVISQFPELPTGCEITCAAAVLKYLGFDADKTDLADHYMRSSTKFYTDDDGTNYGPDPYICFAGDPHKDGYGCYAPVIGNTLNVYFEKNGVSDKYQAICLEDLNSADMEKLIDSGVPVIVWASKSMDFYRYSERSEWTAIGTRRKIKWLGNSHTLVLVGYDPKAYYFMDCDDKKNIVPYSRDDFIERWEENGSQAVMIKITE